MGPYLWAPFNGIAFTYLATITISGHGVAINGKRLQQLQQQQQQLHRQPCLWFFVPTTAQTTKAPSAIHKTLVSLIYISLTRPQSLTFHTKNPLHRHTRCPVRGSIDDPSFTAKATYSNPISTTESTLSPIIRHHIRPCIHAGVC